MDSYILKWRGGAKADGDDRLTNIWLVGPFATENDAFVWAENDQRDGGDPRWHLVTPDIEAGRDVLLIHILRRWDEAA